MLLRSQTITSNLALISLLQDVTINRDTQKRMTIKVAISLYANEYCNAITGTRSAYSHASGYAVEKEQPLMAEIEPVSMQKQGIKLHCFEADSLFYY